MSLSPRRPLPLSILLVLALILSGCTGSLARMVVEPSVGDDLLGPALSADGGRLTEFRDRMTGVLDAEVVRARGSDGTRLFAFALEPGDYGLEWEHAREDGSSRFSFTFSSPDPEPDDATRSRGTVVMLHGLFAESLQLLPQALFFAEHGYRVVLVDLRAHGRSGGRYVTYGVREREDLVALVETLRDADRVEHPLILYGTSLGAAVALHGAATGVPADRVVALAPMADAREAVIEGGPEMLPGWLRWLVSEDRVATAVERAARLAGFDWEEAAVEALAPDVRIPVLLVHARGDRIVPFEHAERLHEALPCSTLRAVDRHGHVSMMTDPSPTAASVLSWLTEERGCAPQLSSATTLPSLTTVFSP